MRSSTFLLHSVLGLLSSLIVDAAAVHGARVDVPVYSTLEYPFTLTARNPTGFHVVVNTDNTPVVTADKRPGTQFRLTNGTLTVLDSELTAVYGRTGIPFPPPLIPVLFAKKPSHEILPFVAETNKRPGGESPLVLTVLAQRESFFFLINNLLFAEGIDMKN